MLTQVTVALSGGSQFSTQKPRIENHTVIEKDAQMHNIERAKDNKETLTGVAP